jgi:hypothetical protein
MRKEKYGISVEDGFAHVDVALIKPTGGLMEGVK